MDGKRYTQPLTLRLDPRVRIPAASLATLNALTREMYRGAQAAQAAYDRGRAFVAQLDGLSGDDVTAYKARVEALAPAPPAGGGRGRFGGFGGRGGRGAAAAAPTLESVSGAMLSAAMGMQDAEAAPTAREVAACAEARTQSASVMASWNRLVTTDLAALNAKRRAAGQPAITLPPR